MIRLKSRDKSLIVAVVVESDSEKQQTNMWDVVGIFASNRDFLEIN